MGLFGKIMLSKRQNYASHRSLLHGAKLWKKVYPIIPIIGNKNGAYIFLSDDGIDAFCAIAHNRIY